MLFILSLITGGFAFIMSRGVRESQAHYTSVKDFFGSVPSTVENDLATEYLLNAILWLVTIGAFVGFFCVELPIYGVSIATIFAILGF
jgi:hypothetical protein